MCNPNTESISPLYIASHTRAQSRCGVYIAIIIILVINIATIITVIVSEKNLRILQLETSQWTKDFQT